MHCFPFAFLHTYRNFLGVFTAATAAVLISAAPAPLYAEAPCAAIDEYDEYLHFKVSYLNINIGTYEFYYTEGSCGVSVMETFPGIRMLRVYTESYSLIDEEGYFLEAHTWDETNDEWEFRISHRDPDTHAIDIRTGRAARKFGDPVSTAEIERADPGVRSHAVQSLIPQLRQRLARSHSGTVRMPIYFDETLHRIPFTVVDEHGTRNVEAFGSPVEVMTVEADIAFTGLHGIGDTLTIEMTRDQRAIPVYGEARIVLGRVRLELTDYDTRR